MIRLEMLEPATVARSRRYTTRDRARQRDLLPVDRVNACGSACSENVGLASGPDGAHFVGISSCASVHSCPACAPIIRQDRATELATAIQRWRSTGTARRRRRVFLVTLTVPHHQGDVLAEVLGRLKASWGHMMEGDSHRVLLDGLGVQTSEAARPWLGICRAVDLTWSPQNGWHPHYHLCVFTRHGVTERAVRRFLVGAWLRSTGMLGNAAVAAACDVREVRDGTEDDAAVSMYAMKAGWEVNRIDLKAAGAGLSPWELLRSALDDGDLHAAHLWREYSLTMKGERAAVWSKGLRAWFGKLDRSDDERVHGTAGARTVHGFISNGDHMKLRRIVGAAQALLYAVDSGDHVRFLRELDIAFHATEPRQQSFDVPGLYRAGGRTLVREHLGLRPRAKVLVAHDRLPLFFDGQSVRDRDP